MAYIKKFTKFQESAAVAEEKPVVKPDKTETKPKTRPKRPSPFPTKNPGEKNLPDPLAKATEEDVIDKFIKVASEQGVDLEKYFPDAE